MLFFSVILVQSQYELNILNPIQCNQQSVVMPSRKKNQYRGILFEDSYFPDAYQTTSKIMDRKQGHYGRQAKIH